MSDLVKRSEIKLPPGRRRAKRSLAPWIVLAVSLTSTIAVWQTTSTQMREADRARFGQQVQLEQSRLFYMLERLGQHLHAMGRRWPAYRREGRPPARFSLRGGPGGPPRPDAARGGDPGERRGPEGRPAPSNGGPPFYPLFVAFIDREIEDPGTGATTQSPLAASPNEQAIPAVTYLAEPGEGLQAFPAPSWLRRAVADVIDEAADDGPYPLVDSASLPESDAPLPNMILMVAPVRPGGSDGPGRGPPGGPGGGPLVGWMVAGFSLESLLKMSPDDPEPKLRVRSLVRTRVPASSDAPESGREPPEVRADEFGLYSVIDGEYRGENLDTTFGATDSFFVEASKNYPFHVLIGGLVISALLFTIAFVMASTESQALALADQMTAESRESQVRMRAVVEFAPDAIVTFDSRGKLGTLNPGAEELFLYSSDEAKGHEIGELLNDSSLIVSEAASGGAIPRNREVEGRRRDGTVFPAELTVSRVELADGVLLTAFIHDVSGRRQAEEALRKSEERYALAAKAANDGLWDWDLESDTIYFGLRWKTMLGFEEDEIGDQPSEWLERIHPSDRPAFDQALSDHLAGRTASFEAEYRIRDRAGEDRWMLVRGVAVTGASGKAFRIAGSQSEITDRKKAESKLRYDALHDSLTGLPNRAYFFQSLEKTVKEASENPAGDFALLFLDLDQFKNVNDTYGHQAGDRCLALIAGRLKNVLRRGEMLARLGGDEFGVIISDLKDPTVATQVSDRVHLTLTEPITLDGKEVFVSASIGITLWSQRPRSAETLVGEADEAMYQAKNSGKARHALFGAARLG